jgi:(p)ppGpp synthase/HD superfamily hydrolase
MAVTGRAKSAIRRSLRQEDRERYIKLGWELARVAFDQVDKKITDKALETAAGVLALGTGAEVLARIGSAELSARDVVAKLYPDIAHNSPRNHAQPRRAVIGLPPGEQVARARCCQPVPGERIVGITGRGTGPVIHAIDCHVLERYDDEPQRWVDLHWTDGAHAPIHDVTLEMTISNEAGVLGRICTLIGEQGANISDIEFVDRKPDFFKLLIDVDVSDCEHLHAVMTAIHADSDVAALARFRNPDRRDNTEVMQ